MRNEDQVRLRHMLEAAQEAGRFAEGKSRNDLDGNPILEGERRGSGLTYVYLVAPFPEQPSQTSVFRLFN